MKFFTLFGSDDRDHSLKCSDPSLAQQQWKDEVDINMMLAKFKIGQTLPTSLRVPTYGDFTGVSDFRSAMDSVRVAKESFADLPLSLRKRFDNDPQQFLEFCSKEENLDELRKMGLALEERAKPAPIEVLVTNPNPPPDKAA